MAQNAQARAAILAQSVNMVQSIAGGTVTAPGNTQNVVNIVPRLVGFCKRFLLEIVATVTNADPANDLTITEWGPANILQQVIFTDLSNNIRIQTAGWHLFALSSVKRGRPFGSVFLNDSPISFGSHWPVVNAPVTIPRGTSATINIIFEIPLSYSDTDFRGAIWLGVTNATANLQFTINPNPTVAAGADGTLAMYTGTALASITSLTYNVYQNYLDQLPTGKNGIVLPVNDISTVYLINNTTQTSIVANQDYPIPYANFRDFLSTFAIYDNGGTLYSGADINYWAIQAANYVNTIKVDPYIVALWTRNMLQTDLPQSSYYFSHRHKPISTIQYGNQELILNANTVNANAKILLGYESFALVNLIAQAGALAIA
jgi:hypothetical protein